MVTPVNLTAQEKKEFQGEVDEFILDMLRLSFL